MSLIINPFAVPNPLEPTGKTRAPVAMAFGAHDPINAEGLGADARTWIAQGVHPTLIVTRVEARNTQDVVDALQMPIEAVQRQVEAVLDDLSVDAVKVGLIGDARMIQATTDVLKSSRKHAGFVGPIVDPGFITKHGEELVGEAVIKALREDLLMIAEVVVVNCFEAEVLVGRRVGDRHSIHDALKKLFDLGGGAAVIKGPREGHAIDYVYDGSDVVEFGRDRVKAPNLRGSGAVFSAAITGQMALGDALLHAVERAKELVTEAIQGAVHVGDGERPVHVLSRLYKGAGIGLNTISLEEEKSETPAD